MTKQSGPRDVGACLDARYWLTAKGWSATQPTEPESINDDMRAEEVVRDPAPAYDIGDSYDPADGKAVQ